MDGKPEKRNDDDCAAGTQERRLPEETDGEMFRGRRHVNSSYVITLQLCYNKYGKIEAGHDLDVMPSYAHLLLSRLNGDDDYERIHW